MGEVADLGMGVGSAAKNSLLVQSNRSQEV